MLSIKEYLNMIQPYLSKMINGHKTQNEWKFQLVMEIGFVSSKDFKETRTLYKKSNNTDIMIGYEADHIIEAFFKSLYQRYKKGLEEKMKSSKFFLIVLIYCTINAIK